MRQKKERGKALRNHERRQIAYRTERGNHTEIENEPPKEGEGRRNGREGSRTHLCWDKTPGILCSFASEAGRNAASGDWPEPGGDRMRRGSGSQEAQRPGEFGVGKRIPNPGGGLLNKRRERQSCAINFVFSLSPPLFLSPLSICIYN
jgi:hypothetical protein